VGLVGFYFADDDQNIPYTILTEWIAGGSLDNVLYGTGRVGLTNTDKMKLIIGIVLGMRYIHACGIIHRDLTPMNVLVTRNLEAKIGDLGSAKRIDTSMTMTAGGGNVYMAPEQSSGIYGNEVDVFAFGFILWEIVSQEQVFKKVLGKGPIFVHNQVCSGTRPPLDAIADEIGRLMSNCWDETPTNRPSFNTIFSSLRDQRYALLDDVDGAAIDHYVVRVLNFEAGNPPQPLEW
jgi:serine/threonine protein kinase